MGQFITVFSVEDRKSNSADIQLGNDPICHCLCQSTPTKDWKGSSVVGTCFCLSVSPTLGIGKSFLWSDHKSSEDEMAGFFGHLKLKLENRFGGIMYDLATRAEGRKRVFPKLLWMFKNAWMLNPIEKCFVLFSRNPISDITLSALSTLENIHSDKFDNKFGQKHLPIWTNTFFQFEQIQLSIWTNTLWTLENIYKKLSNPINYQTTTNLWHFLASSRPLLTRSIRSEITDNRYCPATANTPLSCEETENIFYII